MKEIDVWFGLPILSCTVAFELKETNLPYSFWSASDRMEKVNFAKQLHGTHFKVPGKCFDTLVGDGFFGITTAQSCQPDME